MKKRKIELTAILFIQRHNEEGLSANILGNWQTIHLRSKGCKVELTHQLVMFVEQNEDLNYFIN